MTAAQTCQSCKVPKPSQDFDRYEGGSVWDPVCRACRQAQAAKAAATERAQREQMAKRIKEKEEAERRQSEQERMARLEREAAAENQKKLEAQQALDEARRIALEQAASEVNRRALPATRGDVENLTRAVAELKEQLDSVTSPQSISSGILMALARWSLVGAIPIVGLVVLEIASRTESNSGATLGLALTIGGSLVAIVSIIFWAVYGNATGRRRG